MLTMNPKSILFTPDLTEAKQLASVWEKAIRDCEMHKVLADAAARKLLESQKARDDALAQLKNQLRIVNPEQGHWMLTLESDNVAVVHIDERCTACASMIGKPQ
jgi:hypothetical protein